MTIWPNCWSLSILQYQSPYLLEFWKTKKQIPPSFVTIFERGDKVWISIGKNMKWQPGTQRRQSDRLPLIMLVMIQVPLICLLPSRQFGEKLNRTYPRESTKPVFCQMLPRNKPCDSILVPDRVVLSRQQYCDAIHVGDNRSAFDKTTDTEQGCWGQLSVSAIWNAAIYIVMTKKRKFADQTDLPLLG